MAQVTENMPRKARAIINRMVATREVTPEGVKWLTQATDPFHDTALPTVGFPDVNCSKSLAQCFTFTTNISTPTPASSATWDCHIFNNPISTVRSNAGASFMQPFTVQNDGTWTTTPFIPGTTVPLYSGINALTMPNGLDWQQLAFLLVAQGNYPTVSFPLNASGGDYRVVAAGFEVVNTTPELYKGGSVTSYRSPSNPSVMDLSTPTGGNYNLERVDVVGLPPSTQAQAQLYRDSVTWAAEDGVYSICTLESEECPYVKAVPSNTIAMRPFSTTEQQSAAFTTHTAWSTVGHLSVGFPGRSSSCTRALPWANTGCIFSGLNQNATLQLTVKYYVERIPTIQQPDLLVLTQPSVPYDPKILEIYTEVMKQLPVAVKAAENPLGEWFNDVLEAVQEYAPAVGKIFGGPGQMLGDAAATAAGAALANRRAAAPSPTVIVAKAPKQQQQQQQSVAKPKRRRGRRGKGKGAGQWDTKGATGW